MGTGVEASSWVDKFRTGSDSDRVQGSTKVQRVASQLQVEGGTRSLPPPHAGCPRGDPGSLPVLNLPDHSSPLPTVRTEIGTAPLPSFPISLTFPQSVIKSLSILQQTSTRSSEET